jgi:MoxR-like ATPase
MSEIEVNIQKHQDWIARLRASVGEVVIGQKDLIDSLIMGLITGGHILLEGVPGLAKTLSVKALANAVDGQFQRIQFTPDLLPADIVGTLIYNPKEAHFETRKGPVFANFVLADEINRAPAKVQSALLECMQEKQVTLGDHTYPLPQPFLVLATENPIDQEGTYPLPEAQIDRFMLKVKVGYPSPEEEMRILEVQGGYAGRDDVSQVANLADISAARETIDTIHIDERIKRYIVTLVIATRNPSDAGLTLGPLLQFGASPRATLSLVRASRARALLEGRDYVVPGDVKSVAHSVMRHRLILGFEAEAEGISTDNIIDELLERIPVP